MTHTCVDKLTIIGSDNGLSPERRQAIIWTNAGIFIKEIRLKMSSAKCCSFRLGLNVLSNINVAPDYILGMINDSTSVFASIF